MAGKTVKSKVCVYEQQALKIVLPENGFALNK